MVKISYTKTIKANWFGVTKELTFNKIHTYDSRVWLDDKTIDYNFDTKKLIRTTLTALQKDCHFYLMDMRENNNG